MPPTWTSRALRLLWLLEGEGAVTQKRAAELLKISRMTAFRLLTRLTSEGLLQKEHQADPISGRRCDTWRLAPEPPLLMTELHPMGTRTSAYYCEGDTLHILHREYRHLLGEAGNLQQIINASRMLWSEASHACHIHMRNVGESEADAGVASEETTATAAILGRLALPEGCRSLLHLRVGDHLHGALYLRQDPSRSWFSPPGLRFLKEEVYPDVSSAEEARTHIAPLMRNYLGCLTPDVILWEQNTYAPRGRVSLRRTPLIRTTQVSGTSTDPQLLLYRDALPLWVAGCMALDREHRWQLALSKDWED